MASLELNELEREELERLARSRTVGAAMAFRARIILECAKDLENLEVAELLGVNKHTVGKWRKRFVAWHDSEACADPTLDELISRVFTTHHIPADVMQRLCGRLAEEAANPATDERVCRGTLLSREQYLKDIEEWGYEDARLTHMSEEEVAQWSNAANQKEDKP